MLKHLFIFIFVDVGVYYLVESFFPSLFAAQTETLKTTTNIRYMMTTKICWVDNTAYKHTL